MSSTTANSSNNKLLHHETESRADRKQQRELAAARQSGTVAPAVDAATGQMINPHNPEFITKRPWYLGGDNLASTVGGGESLQHQADQRPAQDRQELSLTVAEELLKEQRQKLKEQKAKGQFVQGQWVEALKKNKMPYQICQIIKLHKKGTERVFDLQYEDGTIEERVSLGHKRAPRPRIRMTAAGSRAVAVVQETTTPAELANKESYDSKRDPYHGYDRDQHNAVLQEKYERKQSLRRQLREQKQQQQQQQQQQKDKKAATASDSDFDDSDVEDSDHSNNDDSDDEFVQRDADERVIATRLARQGGVGGAQMKVTARNLRIREDTAKYLRNLDPNSAYYDPKSRSMRDNPYAAAQQTAEETDFYGDNFTRISGDAVGLAQQQLFAWEAAAMGVPEVHPQANPSQAELLKRQFQGQAETVHQQRQKAVLDKYGGAEYLDGRDGLARAAAAVATAAGVNGGEDEKKPAAIPDRQLRFGVTTEAIEYTRDGRKINPDTGKAGAAARRTAIPSKYEEDVFINGHTTAWGSYFHKGAFAWGYADDHSLMKMSYCTGEKGRQANDEAHAQQYGTGEAGSAELAQARTMLQQQQQRQQSEKDAAKSTRVNRSKLYGEADPHASLDADKVREALLKQQQQEITAAVGTKRKKYHSMEADNIEMTEEMMEAYRLTKEQKNDPLANLGGDELLEYRK